MVRFWDRCTGMIVLLLVLGVGINFLLIEFLRFRVMVRCG